MWYTYLGVGVLMAKGKKNMPSKIEVDLIFQKFGLERGIKMAEGIVFVEVDKLKPHPKNELIYGDEDVSDLITQIEAFGKIVEPIKIKDDYTIISGHRRWKAAKELNYTKVPCEVVRFDSSEEELAALVLYNSKRVKTNEQKAREGIALFETLSVEAIKRRLANLNHNIPEMDDSSISENDSENPTSGSPGEDTKQEIGLTRDKVAKAVGINSGKTFDRMREVITRVDELRESGNTEDSELYIAVLNRTPTAARDLIDVPLESLTYEEREQIKSGKIAPRAFLSKCQPDKADKDKTVKGSTSFKKMKEVISITDQSLHTLEKPAARIGNIDEQNAIIKSIAGTMANLRYLRSCVIDKNPYIDFRNLLEDFKSALPTPDELVSVLDENVLTDCKALIMDQMENLQLLLYAVEAEIKKREEMVSIGDKTKDENF